MSDYSDDETSRRRFYRDLYEGPFYQAPIRVKLPTVPSIPEERIQSVIDRKALLQAEIERNAAELHRLNQFPDEDPFEDGTVIVYQRKFPNNDHIYTYGALRAAGQWYITGTDGPVAGISWTTFVDQLANSRTTNIQVATTWKAFKDAVAEVVNQVQQVMPKNEVQDAAEKAGFELRDLEPRVESLRDEELPF